MVSYGTFVLYELGFWEKVCLVCELMNAGWFKFWKMVWLVWYTKMECWNGRYGNFGVWLNMVLCSAVIIVYYQVRCCEICKILPLHTIFFVFLRKVGGLALAQYHQVLSLMLLGIERHIQFVNRWIELKVCQHINNMLFFSLKGVIFIWRFVVGDICHASSFFFVILC